jgi:hypothetical protein
MAWQGSPLNVDFINKSLDLLTQLLSEGKFKFPSFIRVGRRSEAMSEVLG